MNTVTDSSIEGYVDDDLYEFDYDNKNYEKDTTNIDNDTIKVIELPKSESFNWKQNIVAGLDGMVNSLNSITLCRI